MNPKDTEIIDGEDLAGLIVAACLFIASLVLLGAFVRSL